MVQPIIKGMWKLLDVTKSDVAGRTFDIILHFVDENYYYDIRKGWVERHRYRIHPELDPAWIDLGVGLGIYKFDAGRLLICRAMPGRLRPTTFDDASIAVYEYIGEGPSDWKIIYKRKRRAQLEQTAHNFRVREEGREAKENGG